MARINNLTNFLTDIAGAIKEKKGSEASIPAANFDTEIRNLPSQGTYQNKEVTITQNGDSTVQPDTGYDALESVTVKTRVPINELQQKSYSFTENMNVELEPEAGYDGFSKVTLNINVPTGGSGDVKLFETVEEMQSYTDAEEGDLALVYKYRYDSILPDTNYRELYFPDTVTLDEELTTQIKVGTRLRTPYILITSSAATFGFSISTSSDVKYTSTDGIHYTRTDSRGNPIRVLPYTISVSNWNAVIGKFVTTLSISFGGVFRYSNNTWNYAPNQLTLDDASDLLPDVIAYGKNGIITGDGSIYNHLNSTIIREKYFQNLGYSLGNGAHTLSPYIAPTNGVELRIIETTNDSLNSSNDLHYGYIDLDYVTLDYDNALVYHFDIGNYHYTVGIHTESGNTYLTVYKYNMLLELVETKNIPFQYTSTLSECILYNNLIYAICYDASNTTTTIRVFDINTSTEIKNCVLWSASSISTIELAYDEIGKYLYLALGITSSSSALYMYDYNLNTITQIYSDSGIVNKDTYASGVGASTDYIFITHSDKLYYCNKGETTRNLLITLTNYTGTHTIATLEKDKLYVRLNGSYYIDSKNVQSCAKVYEFNSDLTYTLSYDAYSTSVEIDIIDVGDSICYCRNKYGYLNKSDWFTASTSTADYVFPLSTNTNIKMFKNDNFLVIGWNDKKQLKTYYMFNYTDVSTDENAILNTQTDKHYIPIYCYNSSYSYPLSCFTWTDLYGTTITPNEYNNALVTALDIKGGNE